MKPFDFNKYLKNNPLLKESVNEAPMDEPAVDKKQQEKTDFAKIKKGDVQGLVDHIWNYYKEITGRPESERREEGDFPDEILYRLDDKGVDEGDFGELWAEKDPDYDTLDPDARTPMYP